MQNHAALVCHACPSKQKKQQIVIHQHILIIFEYNISYIIARNHAKSSGTNLNDSTYTKIVQIKIHLYLFVPLELIYGAILNCFVSTKEIGSKQMWDDLVFS